jgi:carbon-monoxide dehydrogenase small subunit
LARQAEGKSIQTIEGLATQDLHPVQEAFSEEHGLQCGYCTPGMIMSTVYLLQRNPNPSDEQIIEGLAGNICRCTGYVNIIKAVKSAAKKMQETNA